MKKLLSIIVLGLLLSGNAYAGITYVCQWKKNKNDIKYQNFIYEIKNKQVYENGKLLKTSYFKINSRNLEFVYKWNDEGSIPSFEIQHKINLKTGYAFEVFKQIDGFELDKFPITSHTTKCNMI